MLQLAEVKKKKAPTNQKQNKKGIKVFQIKIIPCLKKKNCFHKTGDNSVRRIFTPRLSKGSVVKTELLCSAAHTDFYTASVCGSLNIFFQTPFSWNAKSIFFWTKKKKK